MTEQPIDPEEIDSRPLDALKRNWLVYTVCAVSIIACLFFYTQAQQKINQVIDNCNTYWRGQLNTYCPGSINPMPVNNRSEFNITKGLGEIYG